MGTLFVRSKSKNVIKKMMFFIPPTEYISARKTVLRSSAEYIRTRTVFVKFRSEFLKSDCIFIKSENPTLK